MSQNNTPPRVLDHGKKDIVDWYERCDELNSGDLFTTHDGRVVRLDRRVPGDGTRWYVVSVEGDKEYYYDDTVEPGDLACRLD